MEEKQSRVNKFTVILIGILFFSFALRVFALNKFPPELFGDEIDVGLHAYSLAHTARDYRGDLLPTYIHSFSEWRAPLLMYVSVPTVVLFGLNEWGVRLTPVLFGVISIWLLYLFTFELTKRRGIALVAAFLLAITPWHIQYSRTSYEVTLLLSLLLLGLLSIFKSFRNTKWLFAAAFAFAMMIYTYSIATLFVPIFLLFVAILYKEQFLQIPRKYLLFATGLFIVLLLPFAYHSLQGRTGERFTHISIASNPQQAINLIEQQRNVPVFPPDSPFAGTLKDTAEKLAHNRPLAITNAFVTNYLSSFSTQFLFLQGDPNPRQSVGGMGEFYLFMAILLVMGIYSAIKLHTEALKILVPLVVLTPIPSALTIEGGTQATRLFLLNLPIVLLCAFGLVFIYDQSKKMFSAKLVLGIIMMVGACNFLLYVHQYYQHNPVDGYKFWQYGYKDSLTYLKEHQNEYGKIYITNRGDPLLGRTLFWFAYNPAKFQKQFSSDQSKPNIVPGFDGFSFDKFYFVSLNDVGKKMPFSQLLDAKTAYLVSQQYDVGGDWDWRKDPPAGIKVVHASLDPYGLPIYYVVTKQ